MYQPIFEITPEIEQHFDSSLRVKAEATVEAIALSKSISTATSQQQVELAKASGWGTLTYIWDGKLCQESEHLVLIKTLAANYASLAARLTSLHPYEVPEIIALPAIAVEQNYLLWAKSILQ